MNGCTCRWDGNLDGHLLRCKEHKAHQETEKRAHKAAKQAYNREMALTELVRMAERNGDYR